MKECQEVEYNDCQVGEEFLDKNSKGKDKKWRQRKLNNIALGDDFKKLQIEKVSNNVFSCAERLEYKVNTDGSISLNKVWFCKNKLCPICNWRRALKHSYQASSVLNIAMTKYPKAQFLFLTLTVKNVPGSELKESLTDLTKSFDRLFRRAKVKKNLIGFMRATEVTYSEERDDYHPHLHILLMVKPNYFNGSDNYISQAEWSELWKQSAKLDYNPIVDVRKIKTDGNSEDESLYKAVLETAKYPVKPIDSMDLSEDTRLKVVNNLYHGLYKKRQISYGGELKTIYKNLALDSLEDGNLIHVNGNDNLEKTYNTVVAKWFWDIKKYIRVH